MVQTFTVDPWTGKHKIILGFDLGTTFSGVSYAYLFPKYDPPAFCDFRIAGAEKKTWITDMIRP